MFLRALVLVRRRSEWMNALMVTAHSLARECETMLRRHISTPSTWLVGIILAILEALKGLPRIWVPPERLVAILLEGSQNETS